MLLTLQQLDIILVFEENNSRIRGVDILLIYNPKNGVSQEI